MEPLDLTKSLTEADREAVRVYIELSDAIRNMIRNEVPGDYEEMRRVLLFVAAKGMITPTQLAEATGYALSAVSKICSRASINAPGGQRGLGLVTSKAIASDKRQKYIHLTPRGKHLFADVARSVRKLAKEVL